MIVLLVSAEEVQALLDKKPDKGLQAYLAREVRMEQLLPDNALPVAVTLEQVGSEDGRSYLAVVRTYATAEQAEAVWTKRSAPPASVAAVSGAVEASTE